MPTGTADRWFMPAGSPPVLAWQTEITGLQRVPDVTGLPLDQAQATLTAAGFVPGDISYDFHRIFPPTTSSMRNPSSVAPVGETIDLVLSSGAGYDWADNPGDGTEANPYQIQTAGQLESLADHPELWDRHFVLTADLDMAGRTYSTALIASGTDDATAGFQGTPFTGVFDGQGHTIRNLSIQAGDRRVHGPVRHDRGNGPHQRAPSAGCDCQGLRRPAARRVWRACDVCRAFWPAYNDGTIADCSAVRGILIGSNSERRPGGRQPGSMVDCYADVTLRSIGASYDAMTT